MARARAPVLRRPADRRGRWPGLLRGARARRGRGAGSDVVLRPIAGWRSAPGRQTDARHRPESGSARGRVHAWREGGRHAHLDPGAGQFLYRRPPRRGAQRRLAPHGDPVRQGRGRLLGADGQEHGRRARDARPDEVPRSAADPGGAERGAPHGPSPQQFGPADGSIDPALYARRAISTSSRSTRERTSFSR